MNGFNIVVHPYCEHCPYFEVAVYESRLTAAGLFGSVSNFYNRTISCKDYEKCNAIRDFIEKENEKIDHSS